MLSLQWKNCMLPLANNRGGWGPCLHFGPCLQQHANKAVPLPHLGQSDLSLFLLPKSWPLHPGLDWPHSFLQPLNNCTRLFYNNCKVLTYSVFICISIYIHILSKFIVFISYIYCLILYITSTITCTYTCTLYILISHLHYLLLLLLMFTVLPQLYSQYCSYSIYLISYCIYLIYLYITTRYMRFHCAFQIFCNPG